ncbi:peroxidase-like [Penaeus japonicus]|uniref:peroxidase-like n=1 Tax=Penaeus japonicus TaxID=27405 RepID=UPI001C714DBC|nr:peroxidase-like [Penaeus japonicus]
MDRRKKRSALLCFAAMLLVGPTVRADNQTESSERGRRQVYHFSHGAPAVSSSFHLGAGYGIQVPQLQNPYSVYPPHVPTAYFTPYSVYAASPAPPVTPVPQTYHLSKASRKPAHAAVSKTTGIKRPHKPSVSKAPLKGVSVTPAPFPPHPVHVTPAPQLFAHVPHPPPHPPPHAVSSAYLPSPPRPAKGCPGRDYCMPLVACAPQFAYIAPKDSCPLYGGAYGVCCPPEMAQSHLQQLFTEPEIKVAIQPFTEDQLDEAARAGLWELVERDILEKSLRSRNIEVADPRNPEYTHLQFFRTSPLAVKLSRDAITSAEAGDHLMVKFRLTPEQAGFGLQQFSVKDTIISSTCPAPPPCGEKEKYYRTIDGSCNNLDNPSWGQARTTFQRLKPPKYSDGLFRPREGRDGSPLPSARVVSISTVVDADRPQLDLTLSVMQWGQFIDHDLAHTPIFRLGNESGIECCSESQSFIDPSFRHPGCFPIEIPADDPFFGRFRRRCMNFVRSMWAPRGACNFGYAEQMNQITHYLDTSNVYGSSKEEEEEVRLGHGGLLKVQENRLLPAHEEAEECEARGQGFHCFLAGDNRVNEQTDLSVIHTIWMREHNRLARELARLNPHWSDETIYQETRRIVNAMYQHIIYNEWLPIILGTDYMAENGILPQRQGYSSDYDDELNAAIFNEFATAAFRFGHTLVQGMLELFGKQGRRTETLELHEQFNNPKLLYTPGKLDEFLRGLATQPIQMTDNFVTAELTNRLFQTPSMPFGMDLVALNIQRGRDHAIAPYNHLREACGLPKANTFDDLLDVLPAEVVNTFKLLYRSVDDIDPFIAGIAERHASGSILGPTFRCIVGDQFIRLRRGDRFFYEFADMPTSFTEAQLYEIKKASWARILCDNGDMVMEMQPLAMRTPGGLNQRVSCDSSAIPKLDLTPWISAA